MAYHYYLLVIHLLNMLIHQYTTSSVNIDPKPKWQGNPTRPSISKYSFSEYKSKYSPEKKQMRHRSTPQGLENLFQRIRGGQPSLAVAELDNIISNIQCTAVQPSMPSVSLGESGQAQSKFHSQRSMKLTSQHYDDIIKEMGTFFTIINITVQTYNSYLTHR